MEGAGGGGGGGRGAVRGAPLMTSLQVCGRAAGTQPLIGRPCHSGTSKPERSLQLWKEWAEHIIVLHTSKKKKKKTYPSAVIHKYKKILRGGQCFCVMATSLLGVSRKDFLAAGFNWFLSLSVAEERGLNLVAVAK